MANTVERTIQFFVANPKRLPSGGYSKVDLAAALTAVAGLPYTREGGRYMTVDDGQHLCCWPDKTNGRLRARLARVRKRDLPQVEEKGRLTPLDIPDTSGLAEQTHFVVFDHGIVGCEFNFYGPRAARIAEYLVEKAPAGGDFYLAPLLRKDVTRQLEEIGELRVLSIKTRASYSATLRKMDPGLGDALDTLAQRGGAEVLEVVLRTRGRKSPPLQKNLLGFAKKVSNRDDARQEMARFTLRGESRVTGTMTNVDVLSDHLIDRRSIATLNEKTRAVNSASAYEQIEGAYDELKRELHDAAGIGRAR